MSNFYLGRLFFIVTVLTLQGLSLPAPKASVGDDFNMHTLGHSSLAKRAIVATSYETYQISDGTAGTAREAASKLILEPLGLTLSANLEILPLEALKKISKEDMKALSKIGKEGNAQEKNGFNPAIQAANGNKELLGALKRGKTANKVLKLLPQVVVLSAQIAGGKTDQKGKLEKQKKKLSHNLEADKKNSGQKMSSFLSSKSGNPGGTNRQKTSKNEKENEEPED
ncbi:secreted protein [Melampsora americana]|nr:secreted protein [Melampsora americana]